MRAMNKYNRHAGIIAYPQIGRGMRPFPTGITRSPPQQRGVGFKSFARRTGRKIKPVAKAIGNQLLKAGWAEADGFVRDIRSGKNVRKTLKYRGKRLGKRALDIGKANIDKVLQAAKQLGRGRGCQAGGRRRGRKRRLPQRSPPMIGSWEDNNVFM